MRLEADVCVVGAGAAGVAAAVAAARGGARVVLLERSGFLGGTLTTVSLGSMCGLYAVTPDHIDQIVGGFADQVIERLQAHGSATEPVRWLKTASLPYDLFAMKVVLDQLVEEAGVTLMLHTQVVSVMQDDARISHVVVEGKNGRWAVAARQFIDCSGDADLVAWSGAAYEFDRHSLQQPTAMFRFGGVDPELVAEMDRDMLRRCLEEAVADGWDLPRTAGGVFMERPGLAHLNITKVGIDGRAPDPFDPRELTQAEQMGRAQVLMYRDVFRKYVPGFEDAFVLDTGSVIGIRESRRLRGEYVLGDGDIRSAARFDDAIACCAWPMEDHSAGRSTKWVWLENGSYYQIPYRCLLPVGVDNLLVAGRCASATHDAQASLRVTAQCFAMGEAAGTAAALCVGTDTRPRDIDIHHLQARLRAGGAYLGEQTS
ncbi:MAG TPA: FAD-dependent oxidoreductase [Ramlibacter sp.]|nr:FAD-dependent oxidoreductase [Ramlibacter sp.]